MSHRLIPYRDEEGRRRWAVYSTVVDGFVAAGMRATEVVKFEATRAYERQKKQTLEHMRDLLEGDQPYFGYSNRELDDLLVGDHPIQSEQDEAGVEGATPVLTGGN